MIKELIEKLVVPGLMIGLQYAKGSNLIIVAREIVRRLEKTDRGSGLYEHAIGIVGIINPEQLIRVAAKNLDFMFKSKRKEIRMIGMKWGAGLGVGNERKGR